MKNYFLIVIKIFILLSIFLLQACMSIPEMNAKFAEIDRAWLLEYQKHEDLYRFRVIDAPYDQTFIKIKKASIELGLPIIASDYDTGVIIAQANAPLPLSQEEWLMVKEQENPRVKEIGGWMFYLEDDPRDYILTVKATVKRLQDKTLVLLDYELDMPEYRAMGINPGKVAPPTAVKLGSLKFWNKLDSLLTDANLPSTKEGKKDDLWI